MAVGCRSLLPLLLCLSYASGYHVPNPGTYDETEPPGGQTLDLYPPVVGNIVYKRLTPRKTSASRSLDSISDEFKVLLKFSLPEGIEFNGGHLRLIQRTIAYQLGVTPRSIYLVQIDEHSVEFYVIYTAYISDDPAQPVHILLPTESILSRLDRQSLNDQLKPDITITSLQEKLSSREAALRNAVKQVWMWRHLEQNSWTSWQLPFLIICSILVAILVAIGLIFACVRAQAKQTEKEPKHLCLFPVLKPELASTGAIQPHQPVFYFAQEDLPSAKQTPVHIRTKGLLERRGSNASLTIDLNPCSDSSTSSSASMTPSKKSNIEEFLMSAGNRMTRKQLRECLTDPKALHSDFWEIPMNHPDKTEVAGSGTKNRYRTILPNEHSRVQLSIEPDDPLSSYVNANYIRGYEGEEKAFIATQGPMAHTINDFWLMVWQQNACAIVMITKLKEKNKIKCEPYLPQQRTLCDDIEVMVTCVTQKDGYTVRQIHMRKGSETRYVSHYWYTTWPDHKTPANPKQLLALAVDVEGLRCQAASPVIVHCSAGIGRTGCFIAISIGIQQLLEENMVDVLAIVCSLRQDRGGMIQTAEQYEFVHKALRLFEQQLPEAE